jgi:hypothetical protein
MAYIITSKTRRRSPNGRTVVIEHPYSGDTRICDERYAEQKHAKHPGSGWTEPRDVGAKSRIGGAQPGASSFEE